MDKCIFNDSNGLWYELVGNYYLSCVKIPEEEQRPVEVWGQRHLRYIRQDKRVQEMYLRLVVQMAEREGVTEQLKADNQMEWVYQMNNVAERAMEIVNADLIYT